MYTNMPIDKTIEILKDILCGFKIMNEWNTLAKPLKITINEFIITVPILYFNTTSKIQLVN